MLHRNGFEVRQVLRHMPRDAALGADHTAIRLRPDQPDRQAVAGDALCLRTDNIRRPGRACRVAHTAIAARIVGWCW
ncbi:hypothetical protein ACFPRL_22435 [Pseudoclavibacter helvolus]